jgi:hypothetical protein
VRAIRAGGGARDTAGEGSSTVGNCFPAPWGFLCACCGPSQATLSRHGSSCAPSSSPSSASHYLSRRIFLIWVVKYPAQQEVEGIHLQVLSFFRIRLDAGEIRWRWVIGSGD